MRLFFRCLLSGFLIGIYYNVWAQAKNTAIEGKIITSEHVLIEAATIALLRRSDSARVKTTISDKNGKFKFNNIRDGSYVILVSKIGFHKTYSAPFTLNKNSSLIIDDIILHPATVGLTEVVIVDHKRYIEVKPDKTLLNVSHNIITQGVSAYDVLRTAPGVKVSAGGEILYHSGGKVTIAINGKEIKLSDRGIANLLENLSSSNVEQIELISDPSVKYESSGTGGIINIILKKGKNDGLNGTITASGGYGSYYKSNVGGVWNYRNRGLNFFGAADFADNKNYRQIDIDRTSGSTLFDTHYRNTRAVPSFDYNAGIDIGLDSVHTIGLFVKGDLSRYNIPKRTVSNVYNAGVIDSTLLTTSDITRHTSTTLVDLNYNGAMGHTKQTLSAHADYLAYSRHSQEYIKATSRPGDTTYFFNTPPFAVKNGSLKVDYTTPLSKSVSLDAGAKYSYLTYANNQNFEELVNGVYKPSLYTSSFNYSEKISRAYINLTHTGDKLTYRAGLAMERSQTAAQSNSGSAAHMVKRVYSDFFPDVLVAYPLNKNNQLQFVYDSRFDRPGYEKLDPTVTYQDQYDINQGNAYLKPAYAQRFKLSDRLASKYIISLYYTVVSDLWNFTYYQQNDSSKLLKTTNRNLKDKLNAGINCYIPFSLAKWWNVNFTADVSYFRFIDYKSQSNLNKGTQDVNLDLDQDIYLTSSLMASIQSHFETATFYGILNYAPVFYTNVGISERLSSRSTLSLNVWDVTNGNFRVKTYGTFGNLSLNSLDKTESRSIRLTFTYIFGKKTVEETRRHITGNAEEQSRMSNSN